ncbi:MAG TPA: methyltransferase domain-containing protein, partial [Nitrospirota bacterium]
CGKPTVFRIIHPNLRENVICANCRSINRQRQIAHVMLSNIHGGKPPATARIGEFPKDKVVWNLETTRALHDHLKARIGDNYIASEFIDPSMKSGDTRDGIMHVDLQDTHFADDSIDFIVHGDILEHMPWPEKAVVEMFRVLKPGGRTIFTVPFYRHRFTNEKRAVVDDGAEGGVRHILPELYHDDPMRPQDGVLVYNIFAPELLCDMEKAGFLPRLCQVYSPFYGILGDNGIVIDAVKPAAGQSM